MRANCFWPKTLPFNFCLSRARREEGSVEESVEECRKEREENNTVKKGERGKREEFPSETL